MGGLGAKGHHLCRTQFTILSAIELPEHMQHLNYAFVEK